MPTRDSGRAHGVARTDPRIQLLLASSNSGKLEEYRALAATAKHKRSVALELLPGFSAFPPFPESAATIAENAAGKALHYSLFSGLPVLADDSGLCVEALGGRPGVHSARYAGPSATNAERLSKLIAEIGATGATDRQARFVCVIAVAVGGNIVCVISDSVAGEMIDNPRGSGGFGYDPVFLFPPLGKTFAELTAEQKNLHSHRGKAFRKLLEFLATAAVL